MKSRVWGAFFARLQHLQPEGMWRYLGQTLVDKHRWTRSRSRGWPRCHSTCSSPGKTGLIAYFPRFLAPTLSQTSPQPSPSFSSLFSCWLLVGRKCLEQKDKALIKKWSNSTLLVGWPWSLLSFLAQTQGPRGAPLSTRSHSCNQGQDLSFPISLPPAAAPCTATSFMPTRQKMLAPVSTAEISRCRWREPEKKVNL